MKNKDGFKIDDLGNKCWTLNGVFHRTDGPAIESSNGNNRWYLEDVPYSEDEYNAIQLSKKLTNELDSST